MKKSKWTSAQIKTLLEKIKDGNVRARAFAEIARETGKKPNSVRNFYYKLLAQKDKNPKNPKTTHLDLTAHKKNSFTTFTKTETNNLLREVILGTSRGESVRGICTRMAKGNRTGMLRLQNKYRAICATAPAKITAIVTELGSRGYFVKNPLPVQSEFQLQKPNNIITMPTARDRKLTDSDINNLFMGLVRLIKKNAVDEQVPALKNQITVLRSEIERLRTTHKQKAGGK